MRPNGPGCVPPAAAAAKASPAAAAAKACSARLPFLHPAGGFVHHAREMHYLKVYAYRIRRKLGDEGGRILQSDPSVGYRLMAPGP